MREYTDQKNSEYRHIFYAVFPWSLLKRRLKFQKRDNSSLWSRHVGPEAAVEFGNIKFLMKSSKDKIVQDKRVDYNSDQGRQATNFLKHCNKSDFSTFKNRITK